VDRDFDVVIIGSGIGGLATALAAAEFGMKALVLEKHEKLGGGTAASHGGFWVGGNHLARAAGIEDSRDEILAYMRFIGGDELDEERMLTFIDRSPEALEFFDRCGVRFLFVKGHGDHYYDSAPGSVGQGRMLEVELISANDLGEWRDAVAVWSQAPLEMTVTEKRKWGGINDPRAWDTDLLERRRRDRLRGRGVGVVTHFLKQALHRGVTVRPSTAVDRLLFDGERVNGVVTSDGAEVRARNGVVIASGAYESNPEMVATYEGLPGFLSMYPQTITGDGITMAMEIGAACKIIHNNLAIFLGFNVPSDQPGEPPSFRLATIAEILCPHTIVVNQAGHRIGDESFFPSMVPTLRQYVTASHTYANLPCYLIFDTQFQEQLSFADRPPGSPIPDWVSRGNTVPELADKLGIDARGLQATVGRFNEFARTGVDEDFHRGQKHWSIGSPQSHGHARNPSLGSLDTAPFYGLRLHPSAFASAGLLANSAAQVMHQRHRPIPGLYAVGNAAAHTEYGVGYQAGHSLTSGMTFGYLAALHMRDAQTTAVTT
jgi:3-oxosteroid 1-dehydrogenase